MAGRPLLAYVLEAMSGALDEVAVAAKASTAAHPWRCGPSPTSPRHPLAGLPSRA